LKPQGVSQCPALSVQKARTQLRPQYSSLSKNEWDLLLEVYWDTWDTIEQQGFKLGHQLGHGLGHALNWVTAQRVPVLREYRSESPRLCGLLQKPTVRSFTVTHLWPQSGAWFLQNRPVRQKTAQLSRWTYSAGPSFNSLERFITQKARSPVELFAPLIRPRN
jgi:hypothetical protein